MNKLDLDGFRAFLRQTIDVALAAKCDPGDIALSLREEATRLADDGYLPSESRARFLYELPSDDPAIQTRDVLGEVMAGSFGAVRIRYYEYELRHPGSEQWGSMWALHSTETGEFVEWLNAGAFRSAHELERYLQELPRYAPEDSAGDE